MKQEKRKRGDNVNIKDAKEQFNAKFGHEPKVYDVVISDGARKL